jgi:zinc transport system substrate-binding protein
MISDRAGEGSMRNTGRVRHWWVIGCTLWWLLYGFVGCKPRATTSERANSARTKPLVYVDCYPLEFFAQRIGGDAVEVVFPVPGGEDPAYWQPGPAEIAAYQQADLILLNGAGYARWTQYASLPPARVVDTSASFRDQYLRLAEAVVHKHGPQGEHSHEGIASHTWLDPRLAREQARAVRDALRQLLPESKAAYVDTNWSQLDRQLDEWQIALEQLARPAGRKMFASHPVYDYLARFCQWDLKSVHWEPGEMPSQEEWNRFEELRAQHDASVMLWEDEPLEEIRNRLDALAVRPVVYLVCGNRPSSGDFLSVMRDNLQRLAKALEPSGEPAPAANSQP